MTLFTDPEAAVEEAVFLAEQTGWPQAIVSDPGGMKVVANHRSYGMEVLEVIHG